MSLLEMKIIACTLVGIAGCTSKYDYSGLAAFFIIVIIAGLS